jgi:PcfJ-like protein
LGSQLEGLSERVGFAIGAPMEFIDKNPELLESWSIHEWRAQAASWLALNQRQLSIQQIKSATSAALEFITCDLSAKMGCFMSRLDQYACGFARHAPSSWLSSYNYMAPKAEQQCLYRQQAVSIFPMVIQQIFACPKEESTLSIRMVIDRGLPLVDHIMKLFKCSRASVRHLNTFGGEYNGTRWQGRLKELLLILSSLDVNKLPKSAHEWNVFDESIDLLFTATKMPITSISSRLLLGELSKSNWNYKINPFALYKESALLIESFAVSIRHAIVATGWINANEISVSGWGTHHVAVEAACSLGLLRLVKLARKWRSVGLELDSESLHNINCEFPVLMENTMYVGEMNIVQMKNKKQLVEEGDRMQNCVASYVAQCACGQSYIFSVRDKNGKSCATVEYGLTRPMIGLPEFVLVQKNGFQNSSPGSDCYEALRALNIFSESPDVKRKILPLLVYQKASEKLGENLASIYMRSLDFIKFLDKEAAGRFDFDQLVADTLREEEAFKESVPNASKITNL